MSRPITHGYTRNGKPSPEWLSWKSMKARCLRASHKDYPRYGGRGIGVCNRWINSFENFLADMGHRPSDAHSLDRYPNKDGNYEPGNCRWATRVQQQRNKGNNALIEYNGERCCATEWGERLGIKHDTISHRLKAGWTVAQSLGFEPPPAGTRGQRYIEFRGQRKSIAEWSRHLGLCDKLLGHRLNKLGWTVEKALSTPVLSTWSRYPK